MSLEYQHLVFFFMVEKLFNQVVVRQSPIFLLTSFLLVGPTDTRPVQDQ